MYILIDTTIGDCLSQHSGSAKRNFHDDDIETSNTERDESKSREPIYAPWYPALAIYSTDSSLWRPRVGCLRIWSLMDVKLMSTSSMRSIQMERTTLGLWNSNKPVMKHTYIVLIQLISTRLLWFGSCHRCYGLHFSSY